MPDRLAEHPGNNAIGRPLHQLQRKRSADAVAEKEELANAEVVHQPQLIVGKGIPGVIDRDWTGGIATCGIALVHRDAMEIVLELLHRVDDRVLPIADPRVQAAAGRNEQRKAGPDLLVTDVDVALLVE